MQPADYQAALAATTDQELDKVVFRPARPRGDTESVADDMSALMRVCANAKVLVELREPKTHCDNKVDGLWVVSDPSNEWRIGKGATLKEACIEFTFATGPATEWSDEGPITSGLQP